MILSLLAQTELPEFGVARALGSLVGILLPLAFFVSAVKTFSASGHSRRCALALAAATGGWTLSSLAYALKLLSPDFAWVMVVAAILTALLILAGIGMAIAGFMEIAGTDRPMSGRGQAIGALVVGVIWIIAAAFGFLNADRHQIPEDWRMAQQTPGSKLSFPAKGFTFTVPTNDWIQVDPKKVNPNADLAFVHVRKRIFIMAIAVNLPPGASVTQERLTEVSRAELKQVDASAVVSEAQPETVGPLLGTTFTVDARVNRSPLRYRYWVHATRERAYQVVMWATQADFQESYLAAAATLRGFELIGP